MSQSFISESKTPEHVNIEIRKFDKESFKEIPEYFWANSPFKTHMINGLSILFPEGERFFIKSVLNYRDQITDAKLLKDIKEFSAQEAQHTLIHQAMNELPTKYGYPVEACEEGIREGLRNFLKGAEKSRFVKRAALATTVCMEHFTAILAFQVITNGDEMFEGLDPNVRSLFEWHAIEETEHKSVAFDVYQATGGGYLFLRLALIWSTAMFLFGAFYNTTRMLIHDGNIKKWDTWKEGMSFMFGREQGFLIRPFGDWLAFFKPGFHPWKQHVGLDTSKKLAELKGYLYQAA